MPHFDIIKTASFFHELEKMAEKRNPLATAAVFGGGAVLGYLGGKQLAKTLRSHPRLVPLAGIAGIGAYRLHKELDRLYKLKRQEEDDE